jgi:hypothetical protein
MASNRERYFKPSSTLGDSSKLRFSQACQGFNLNLFNSAAKSDKLLVGFIENLKVLAQDLKQANNKNSLAPIIQKARENSKIYLPRTFRIQQSPNAPNNALAFSLAAA